MCICPTEEGAHEPTSISGRVGVAVSGFLDLTPCVRVACLRLRGVSGGGGRGLWVCVHMRVFVGRKIAQSSPLASPSSR